MFYEIDELNAIRVFEEGQTVPFLFQPHYPNGTPWEDYEAAERWANAFIAYRKDPENNPFPTEPPVENPEAPVGPTP